MSNWMRLLKSATLAASLMVLLVGGRCDGITMTNDPDEPALRFDPPQLFQATVGQPFSYSFCRPALTSAAELCGSLSGGTTTPSGGKPNYHFQLGSGVGFPPVGLILGVNGILSGTPTVPGSKAFEVCAVDLAANKLCRLVTVNVTGTVRVNSVTWSCATSASPLPGWRNCTGTVSLTISRTITSGYVSAWFNYPTSGAFFHGELAVTHDGQSAAKTVTVNVTNEYVSRCVASYPTTVDVYDGRQSANSAPLLVSAPVTLTATCQ